MAENYNPDQKLTGVDLSTGSAGRKPVEAIYRLFDDSQEPPVERSMLVYVDGTYEIFAAGTGDVISAGNYDDLILEPDGGDEEGYTRNDEDTRPDNDEQ